MIIHLNRLPCTKDGTFGELVLPDCWKHWYTVERPWLDNAIEISCIPNGEYDFVPCYFNKGGYAAYEVINVTGRTHIKMHIANYVRNVIGCIGVGDRLGHIGMERAVLSSKKALEDILKILNKEEHTLIISGGYK